MKEEEAQKLATYIKEEAPHATVQIVQDGLGEHCVDVAGQVQYKFIVKSMEQWQSRRAYIMRNNKEHKV